MNQVKLFKLEIPIQAILCVLQKMVEQQNINIKWYLNVTFLYCI